MVNTSTENIEDCFFFFLRELDLHKFLSAMNIYERINYTNLYFINFKIIFTSNMFS